MIVGKTEQDATRINESLDQHEDRNITMANGSEDAISIFQQYDFDIILFSDALDETETRKLSRLFRFQDEHVMLVETDHNEPEALLQEAMRKRKRLHKPVYAFTDDALKEAIFNINLS